MSKVSQTNIPPRETVTYCRETQTAKEVIEKPEGIIAYWVFFLAMNPKMRNNVSVFSLLHLPYRLQYLYKTKNHK